MKIGIAAPVSIPRLAHRLDLSGSRNSMPTGLGGTPTANLIEALLDSRHSVVVFTLDRSIREETVLVGPRLRICVCPCRQHGRARDLFAFERRGLERAIAREALDLIHAHWTYEFALAALDSGRPVLVTAHDAPWQILRHTPDAYRVVRLAMAGMVARRARHLTAVSPHVARHFARWLRFPHPIAVIPNPIPDKIFAVNACRIPLASTQPFTVACVLTGWKGLKNGPAALRAFALLRRELSTCRPLLFGADYAALGPAERWALEHSVASGVTFAGPTPQEELMSALANEVDVLLHPSREESFGMGLAEAMALGLAVVGGKIAGAVPWLLEHGDAGVLTDVESATDIAAALFRLARDLDIRRSLGEAARESAWRRFRASAVAREYSFRYEAIA